MSRYVTICQADSNRTPLQLWYKLENVVSRVCLSFFLNCLMLSCVLNFINSLISLYSLVVLLLSHKITPWYNCTPKRNAVYAYFLIQLSHFLSFDFWAYMHLYKEIQTLFCLVFNILDGNCDEEIDPALQRNQQESEFISLCVYSS